MRAGVQEYQHDGEPRTSYCSRVTSGSVLRLRGLYMPWITCCAATDGVGDGGIV
jgi:hypothetical protein